MAELMVIHGTTVPKIISGEKALITNNIWVSLKESLSAIAPLWTNLWSMGETTVTTGHKGKQNEWKIDNFQ